MAIEDVKLSVCEISYGGWGIEENLGYTEGGVIITFESKTIELKTDQTGDVPINEVTIGSDCYIKINLAESNLKNLALALNQTRKYLNSKYGFCGTNVVGSSLRSLTEVPTARSFLLKPIVNGMVTTNSDLWWRFPRTIPLGNFDLNFSKSSQQIIPIIIKCFPDSHNNWYYSGDEVAATFGDPIIISYCSIPIEWL